MAIKKNNLIAEMTKAIKEGNAAVFCGAGMSRPSGFADWKLLIKPLAEEINLEIDKENDLVSVAQYYYNERRTRNSINQLILDSFSKGVGENKNIDIITRLPISTYWTTNYDCLIEEGIKRANRNPDVKQRSDQLPQSLHDRDAVVYKMHGSVENPSEAVLTKDDYERYAEKRGLFRTALQGDLVSKTFLFVGFSFTDPNLNFILSQIRILLGENVRDHYCVIRKCQRDDFENEEEYGYYKAKQELQERDLRRYGIQTCFIDAYSELTEILLEIEKCVKMNNVFISGSASEFNGSWDKETANVFARKLSAALVEKNYRITSGFGLGIGSSIINGALDVIYSQKYKHVDEHLCLRPFPQTFKDDNEREERYDKYRREMIDDVGIAIFIFGNKKLVAADGTETIVNASGCRKEFDIAVENHKMVIPIASTGYMAKELMEHIKANISDFAYLKDYIDKLETELRIDDLIQLIIEMVDNWQTH